METKDRTFLKRNAWMQLFGFFAKIAAPLGMVITARLFPQDVFGLFTSLQLLVFTLARLSTAGLDRSLVRLVAAQLTPRELEGNEIPCSTYLVALLSILLAGIGIFWERSTADSLGGGGLSLVLCGLVPWSLLLIWTGALEGARLPQYKLLLVHILALVATPALAYLFAAIGLGPLSLPLGFLVGTTVSALLALWALLVHFPRMCWHPISLPSVHLLRATFPVALSELLPPLLQRVDLWMVLALLGPRAAAVYSLMLTLGNGLRTIRQGFDNTVLIFASAQGQEKSLAPLQGSYQHSVTMVCAIQSAIAVVLLLFPNEILSIAGKEYAVDAHAVGLLVSGHLWAGFWGLSQQVLIGKGKAYWVFALGGCCLVLALAADWYLIPLFGLRGACLAAGLVLFVQSLGSFLLVRFGLGLRLYSWSISPFFLTAALLTIFAFGRIMI